jgi:hypothetical protein
MISHMLSKLPQHPAIAHYIPGRLHLKLLNIASALARDLDLDDVQRFSAALCGLDGARSVRLNIMALSCAGCAAMNAATSSMPSTSFMGLASAMAGHGALKGR